MKCSVQKYLPKEEEILTQTDDKKLMKIGHELSGENISVDIFICAENPIVFIYFYR